MRRPPLFDCASLSQIGNARTGRCSLVPQGSPSARSARFDSILQSPLGALDGPRTAARDVVRVRLRNADAGKLLVHIPLRGAGRVRNGPMPALPDYPLGKTLTMAHVAASWERSCFLQQAAQVHNPVSCNVALRE